MPAAMLELVAAVVSLDGSRAIRGQAPRRGDQAAALGARVGAQLLADGAGEILAAARIERDTAMTAIAT